MKNILEHIRRYLVEVNCAAILISKNNAHCSEYIDVYDNDVQFVSNFTGSNGFIIVTLTEAVLFVDGRYTLQAIQEVNPNEFKIENYTQARIDSYIKCKISIKSHILYNENTTSIHSFKHFEKISKAQHLFLKPSDFNFIDQLKENLDNRSVPEIVDHSIAYAGQSREDKIQQVTTWLRDQKFDGIFLNTAESIGWLFNIRSPERAITPAPLCYAFVDSQAQAYCFFYEKQITENLKNFLGSKVKIFGIDEVLSYLKNSTADKKIALDPYEVCIYWYDQLLLNKAQPDLIKNPINDFKAIKNPIEIIGAQQAHIHDSAAVCSTIYWLKNRFSQLIVTTEMDIENQLLSERKQHSVLFQGVSFDSIVGSGPNGAIIHYSAQQQSNRTIHREDTILIDSGGHYLNGTTDVTRTLYVGNYPSLEIIRNYTLVLKGQIALTRQIFPEGTTGSQLDILARQFLWQQGLDYKHGTGHGVGSYLNVHEGPQSISSSLNNVPLKIGMIVSNEPGYYKQNHYGIRLENLMVINPSQFENYMCFKTLTLIPFEPTLIDRSLLNDEEISWINAYHQQVAATIIPFVSKEVQKWLIETTQILPLLYSHNKY